MRVSLVQMDVKLAQPADNQRRVLELLEQAALDKPDVIVLPEMWNTGYALADLAGIADKDGKETQELLADFAKKHAVNLVAGSVSTERDGHFYNTSYVFGRDGRLLSAYDKVHLFGLMAEDQYLTAGQTEHRFEVDGVAAAGVICYDIRFPEWLRTLMTGGAEVLFVVAQWPEQRIAQWEILLKARAVENQAFVVAVNRVGEGPDDHFSGHSLVIDPLGNTVLQAPDNQEGVFTVDLDLSQIEAVRGAIPVFEDRRPDLYR